MTYRPSFTEVTLSGDELVIEGRSPEAQFQIAIHVVVMQGGRYGTAAADAPVRNWTAKIPIKEILPWPVPDLPDDIDPSLIPEPAPPSVAFNPLEPVEVFGTEIRGNPLTAIAWRQEKEIQLPGGHAAPPPGH
jgi:hypothetical protein